MNKSYSLSLILATSIGISAFGQLNPTPVLQFDGINDYIMLDSQSGDNVRSIEMWFNPSQDFTPSSPDPQTLYVRDVVGETGEWGLCLAQFTNYKGNILFFKNIGNNFYYVISDANTWSQNTWYHVAGVIDPVSGMKLYVDGVLQSSTDPDTSPTDVRNEAVTIGNWTNNVGREFGGMLDEIRVWDRALSQQEIIDNMCSLTQWSDSTGLIAYWKLNEGSGNIAYDDLGNHSGVIFGATYTVEQYCSINALSELGSSDISLNVFPNPTKKEIQIECDKAIDNVKVRLYDLSGKLVYSDDLNNFSNHVIDIESLDSGSYTLVIDSDYYKASKSVVKF